jgi:hypothetical protein
MLSRKHTIAALGLLLSLTGLLNVSAQEQKKRSKVREVSTQTSPSPVVQILQRGSAIQEYASVITPCDEASLADARIPLTVNVQNFSTPNLTYKWELSGGERVGEGANVTWDLSRATPGTYTANVVVDNNLNNGCTAFTSTKVIVRPCPPPPVVCPDVSVSGPPTVTLGAPATFTATLSGGTPNITPTFNWRVTNGTISSGQGTPSIQVDTTGLSGQSITATLSVEGYNMDCGESYTVHVPRKISSTLVDNYAPIQLNDEKARLDNFAIQLQNDPNAKGYIVVFGGVRAPATERQKRIKRAYDYLVNTRGISADRLVTVPGGQREVTTTELWIVPLGADPPSAQ